jgi:drug/metabolite transporter (DMT)-like permease
VLFVVVIGYTTWFWLMRTYAAASLHAFTFLSPIFGVLFGHMMLGEPVGPAVLMGLTLVAIGIWLVNRPDASP